MKKFIVIIVAFLHLSASAGVTMHMHYCMGKLADWGLYNKESNICGKCGMEKSEKKNNGCCKIEHKFFKDNTDQKAAESAYQLMQVVAVAVPTSFFEIPIVDFPAVTEENTINHGPPRSCGVAVYIRNCVFLI